MSDSFKVFDRVTVVVSIMGVLVMATALVTAVRGSTASAGGQGTVAEVELTEFSISGDLTVPVGQVALRVTNNGSVARNLSLVDGFSTPNPNPAASSTINLGEMVAGIYRLLCTVPGHERSV